MESERPTPEPSEAREPPVGPRTTDLSSLPPLVRPFVTPLLIGTCATVWTMALVADVGRVPLGSALLFGDPVTLLALGAKHTALVTEDGELWRLVGAMFLHAGAIHVSLNLFALFQLGRLLEPFYGPTRFLALYVLSGVAGSIASCFNVTSTSVGASGAIFGLLGAAVGFTYRHRDQLPPGVARRLRRSLLPWVLLNVALGFAIPRIDNLAHMGGLGAGFVLSLLLPAAFADVHVPIERRFTGPRWLGVLSGLTLAWGLAGVAYGLVASFDDDYGLEVARSAYERHPEDPALGPTYMLGLLERGRTDAAAEVALRVADGLDGDVLPAPFGILPQEFLQRSRPMAAADLYRALNERFPDDAMLLNNYAWFLLEQAPEEMRDPWRALELAGTAVEQEGENPYYLGTLGTAYLRLGEDRTAAAHLARAVELHRRSAAATDLYLLVVAQVRLGDRRSARANFERAFELDPDSPYRSEAAHALGVI